MMLNYGSSLVVYLLQYLLRIGYFTCPDFHNWAFELSLECCRSQFYIDIFLKWSCLCTPTGKAGLCLRQESWWGGKGSHFHGSASAKKTQHPLQNVKKTLFKWRQTLSKYSASEFVDPPVNKLISVCCLRLKKTQPSHLFERSQFSGAAGGENAGMTCKKKFNFAQLLLQDAALASWIHVRTNW